SDIPSRIPKNERRQASPADPHRHPSFAARLPSQPANICGRKRDTRKGPPDISVATVQPWLPLCRTDNGGKSYETQNPCVPAATAPREVEYYFARLFQSR